MYIPAFSQILNRTINTVRLKIFYKLLNINTAYLQLLGGGDFVQIIFLIIIVTVTYTAELQFHCIRLRSYNLLLLYTTEFYFSSNNSTKIQQNSKLPRNTCINNK